MSTPPPHLNQEGGQDGSATSNHQVCIYCMDLKKEIFEEKGYKYRPFSFSAYRVVTAPSIDCPYCRLLIDGIRAFDDVPDPLVARWELQTMLGLVLKGDDNRRKHQLEFFIDPEERRSQILPSFIRSSKHVSSIWDDPHEIEVLERLLVKDAPQPSRLPTRVLDLGVGGGDLDDIRIVKSLRETEEALYAALSHCWLREDIETTKTVSSNFASRLENLPLTYLPDSFQQAVSVCRRLGVRYLWIDSLCIIQDDNDDWKREAADMNSVYTNAWFTIAMHGSTRGTMPFRDVDLTVGGQSAVVHVRRVPELLEIVENKAIAPPVGQVQKLADNEHWSSVAQRGWCYQERALSSRMIHFTDHEYLYEERGILKVCQCKQHFGWGMGFSGSLRKRSSRLEGVYRDWGTLVQQYTPRMFGRRSDLLPGFAGVAKSFGSEHDLGRYIAGLWEKDLIKYLCWRSVEWVSSRASSWACENCRPHPRRIPWTNEAPIPSFSWASRFGPCEFVYESWEIDGRSTQVASIERIKCLMEEENPFLNIRPLNADNWPKDPCGRYLRIRGSLYSCLHFSTYGRGFEFNVDMGLCQKEYAWAVPDYFVRHWDLNRNIKEILEDARKCGNSYCIDAGDDLPPDNSRIYLLPLFEFIEGKAKVCLILRPCSEKITAEVLDTVEGEDSPHWMERIGISIFNGSRFEHLEGTPDQVVHLM